MAPWLGIVGSHKVLTIEKDPFSFLFATKLNEFKRLRLLVHKVCLIACACTETVPSQGMASWVRPHFLPDLYLSP
jgi:hypothetical protein